MPDVAAVLKEEITRRTLCLWPRLVSRRLTEPAATTGTSLARATRTRARRGGYDHGYLRRQSAVLCE